MASPNHGTSLDLFAHNIKPYTHVACNVLAIELRVKVLIACEGLKVREGRRAGDFPRLCVFLDYTAISEHI